MKKLLFSILSFSLLLLPACTVLKLVAGHEMADCRNLAGKKLEEARARFGEPMNSFSPIPVTVTLDTPDPQHPLSGKTPKDYNWYLWCFKGGFIEMGALTATSSRSDWIRQTICYSPDFQPATDRPKILAHCDQFGTESARKSFKELQGFCDEIKGRAFTMDMAMQKFGTLVRAHTLLSDGSTNLNFVKFASDKKKALIIYARVISGSLYDTNARVAMDDCEVQYQPESFPEVASEDARECSKITSLEEAAKLGEKVYERHNTVWYAKGNMLAEFYYPRGPEEFRYNCRVYKSREDIEKVIKGAQKFEEELFKSLQKKRQQEK